MKKETISRPSIAVIALMVLALATPIALLVTSSLQDAPSWWQAILSGVAVLATSLFWHVDRTQTRADNFARDERERATLQAQEDRYLLERQERELRERQSEEAEGRSAMIVIIDDVLVLDAWVRQLIREGCGPDSGFSIGGREVPVVATALPLEKLRTLSGNLHRMGPGSLSLQRAVFRYRQLVELLRASHDPSSATPADFRLPQQTFQEMLALIAQDLDTYLPIMHRSMWGDDADATLLMEGRRSRQESARR